MGADLERYMRILGFTIIRTKLLNDMKKRANELECALNEAKKNDYRDSEGRFTKAPRRIRRHGK